MAVEIPGYEGFEDIARGGFGVVYRAQDVRLGRVVAVKVLSRVELDDQALERFDRERRAMGALSWHPHIVVVHDSGRTAGGEPYLVMEYLEGGSLADDLAARGALPWDEAVARVIEVAGALQVAHDAGLLHRDLKPANIMRGPYGEAKLTDFGIVGTEDAGHTATGMVSFTLGHAAPEVLQGQRATARSDVYSLASTLYELVAGRAPFLRPGEDSIVPAVMRTVNEPVPDLGRADAPPGLMAVLTEAMAKDPESRPAEPAALGRELQQVQREAGVPVTELRLDPKAGGADLDRSGATITAARATTGPVARPTGAAIPPPPPPPPAPVGPPGPTVVADSDGSGPSRGVLIAAAAAVVIAMVAAAVVAVFALGDGGSGDEEAAPTSSSSAATSAPAVEEQDVTSTTASVSDPSGTSGTSASAELEAFCDSVDEYVAGANALAAGVVEEADRAVLDQLGTELTADALDLATSGLSAEEQDRYQECSDALTEAGQG